MKTPDELEKGEIIDLLNRCWMNHDGMWFLNCFRTFGIERANEMNKAAIRALAPLEIARLLQTLGIAEGQIRSGRDISDFFTSASKLLIPEFMGVRMSFPEENRMRWEFEPFKCFAYRGMKRIGAVEQYECGVIYRIECWLEALGLTYTVPSRPVNCRMIIDGTCSGDFVFPAES